jgi:Ran GTPase-activating protein (RanGAP) involved in mRNA processing and transport
MLAGSYAGEDGIGFLAQAFIKNKALLKLKRLDLCACGALVRGGVQLVKVLESGALKSIERLNLRRNGLQTSLIQMSTCLQRPNVCQELKELLLSHNQFGPTEVKALAMAFRNDACPMLKVLDLGHNELGNEGAIMLANAFTFIGDGDGLSLDELDLSGNDIKDDGARKIFASFVSFSRALKVLKMNTNVLQIVSMTGGGGGGFQDAVEAGAFLELRELDLSYNLIQADGCRSLFAAMHGQVMRHLELLDISCNSIGLQPLVIVARLVQEDVILPKLRLIRISMSLTPGQPMKDIEAHWKREWCAEHGLVVDLGRNEMLEAADEAHKHGS